MEIQSNAFVPKYLFLTYLKPLVYGMGFIYLAFVFIQKGWYGWEYILILTLFGFNAIRDSKELIKEVEFGEKDMIVRYYFWGEKIVDYQEIKNVNLNFSIVFADVVISLKGMTNSMELQKRVADVLGKKRIREINIEKEVEKKSKAGKKILRYTLAFTLFVGIVASSIVSADLATWSFLLFFLFIITMAILSIFIKP